ncbi:MAG: peptidylprolyl isomerase [Oscillospiraceae bacterium]|nr:peptidylprolyl isomerase [Oscillospiraceae bacterium]
MYEAAMADGFTMPEKEQQMIEEALAEADLAEYGNGVTLDDIRKTLEIQALSSAYYYHKMEELEPSEDEIRAYYESDPKSYQTCGLAGFSVSYATEGSEDSEEMTQEQAKELAEQLKNTNDVDAFVELVGEILLEYEGYTQEELDANLPSVYNNAYGYTANNELSEWAFGGAKVNDTYMLEGTGAYYIYIMSSEPVLDETETVNVRHILFMEQDDNMAAAEDALAEWESGEKTEDSFAALAEQYSEDGGSNTNGGLYESVYPGQMVQTFNDWCFDESRKSGDTGIVETEYGVHVMYFSSTGDPLWMQEISGMMVQQSYNDWYTEVSAQYPITIDEAVMKTIDG